MSDKQKFHHAEAMAVAEAVATAIAPGCERVIIAGSLRRKKAEVGDVEVLYIPKMAALREPAYFFDPLPPENLAEKYIQRLLADGLSKRLNKMGRETWGTQIKLARDMASGIPVDLFSATETNWYNYLVCRTGPAESNIRIAKAAKRVGWKWEPYSEGFWQPATGNESERMESEQAVFKFVGLPYFPPEDRK